MTGLNPTGFETVQAWSVVAPETMTKVPDAYAQWNDWDVLGRSVGVANRQASIDLLNEQRLEEIQTEKDKDVQDMGLDIAIADMAKMQEQRLERINGDHYCYGDLEFDLEDVQKAMTEHGDKYKQNMTDEQAMRWDEIQALLEADGLTPDEKRALVEEAIELAPELAEDANSDHDVRVKAEKDAELTNEHRSYAEELLNDEPQQVEQVATDEGFSLDEPTPPVVQAKPFSLDM